MITMNECAGICKAMNCILLSSLRLGYRGLVLRGGIVTSQRWDLFQASFDTLQFGICGHRRYQASTGLLHL